MSLQTKSFIIENKIFDQENLIDIANIVYRAYIESKDENAFGGYFRIDIEYDNSSSSKDDLEILKDKSLFRYKKPHTIRITFRNLDNDDKIWLVIRDNDYISYCEVTSENSSWLNSIYKSLEEMINSINGHDNFIVNNMGFSRFFLSFFIIMLYLSGPAPYIYSNYPSLFKNPIFLSIAITALLFTFSILMMGSKAFIDDFWPSIEFNFHPDTDRLTPAKRKRKLVKNVFKFFFIVVIPILGIILAIVFAK